MNAQKIGEAALPVPTAYALLAYADPPETPWQEVRGVRAQLVALWATILVNDFRARTTTEAGADR